MPDVKPAIKMKLWETHDCVDPHSIEEHKFHDEMEKSMNEILWYKNQWLNVVQRELKDNFELASVECGMHPTLKKR